MICKLRLWMQAQMQTGAILDVVDDSWSQSSSLLTTSATLTNTQHEFKRCLCRSLAIMEDAQESKVDSPDQALYILHACSPMYADRVALQNASLV